MNDKDLIKAAFGAMRNAYAPYSGYKVGAALLAASGTVYIGCNIENASFSPTNCAERTAFFSAISAGEREFQKIAVVGGKKGEEPTEPCPPCGVCRQVMREFCAPDFAILLSGKGGILRYTLEELLPAGFGGEMLGGNGL